MHIKRATLTASAIFQAALSTAPLAVWAADSNAASGAPTMRAAWQLYSAHKYAESANAFEALIRTSAPNAQLYYYAALANRDGGHSLRAKQLFEYIVKNFPNTTEAKFSSQMVPAQTAAKPTDSELPQSVKDAMPKEMQGMLDTEMGRQTVKEMMGQRVVSTAMVRNAETQGILNKTNRIVVPEHQVGHPFAPEDIAKDGAGGIDQARHPNCWFEASMAALASLPRGQRLISSMIRYGTTTDYVVRFPNDGVEYAISEKTLDEGGIHDKAKWASILDCAQCMKFPDNAGAEGANGDQSRLEVGLGCITGCKAEVILPKNCSAGELSSFIDSAIRSKNPVVCATYGAYQMGTLPDLVVPQHAYTIIGFDPSRSMITIRNPHGEHARRFSMPSDPHHEQFEQLDDGVFKIDINNFQKYFHSLARSFI